MPSETKPKVSIGLPVYNGSKFLAEAFQSALSQTYDNFELIVSDNASTDATADICKSFASKDGRITYHRHDRNMGAGPNHNWVARRASGKYFKWASDDDLMEPQYLEKCVAALERAPDAVLCQSVTRIVSESGESIATHLAHLDSARASDRFAAIILKPHWCVEVLGVIRTSALARTNLEADYFGGDKTLLAELALLGPFLQVPEPLFINRDHPGRSMRAVPFHKRHEFHTSNKKARVVHWALYTDYWRAVGRHVAAGEERLRCYAHLLRWWFTNMHALRVSLDLVCVTMPGVAAPMFRLRQLYHSRGIGSSRTD